MLHRLVHLTLVGAALFLFADSADARGRRGGRGGCGGGGCGGGGCGGGGCYMGGGYGGGGCYGGGCYVGGYGGGGCYGGICGVPGGVPATGGTPSKDGMKKDGGDEGTIARPANLLVTLPADARLYVDGHQTRSTSGQRLLTTPRLQPGREYHYTLRAEVTRGGEVQRVTQRVTVRAGQETRVSIDVPTTVAAR